jgi:aspartyl-tRNA(Asn)/glutamyl-tRNA(Gln) amidotransferase subunit A
MITDDLAFASLTDISAALARGDVSAVELVELQLQRIDTYDEQLNAYITVLHEQARLDAARADSQRRAGASGTLLGVPLALKDLLATAGVSTTAGSRILASAIPEVDAPVVRHLRAAGAVILGKTNMMEFAYGYPHPDYGETRNPWDLDRSAGGSSGGSAAAVAAGLAYGALGSDTGGSIRSPASYCGIAGLKPTYDLISREGVVPLSWSLDHIGPLARTVSDVALLLAASTPEPAQGFDPEQSVAGVRVGVVDELFDRHVEPEVRRVASAALDTLQALGVILEPVRLECVPLVGPTIMPIVQAEASAYHWPNVLARPQDYSDAVRENLRLGGLVLAKDYLNAQRVRRRIVDEVTTVLRRVDALVFPTQPIVAPPLDAYQLAGPQEEADVLDVEIGHTGLANLSGHPALSLPCGLTDAGLPVGLQFTGRAFGEGVLLAIGHAYEQATDWHRRRPPFPPQHGQEPGRSNAA